ncbi:MAG: UDP-N-acetylmuramate dehydrogenase [Chloroflexota bacterium]|nr:UDP-N-acetylmuramate dehydrogenase [Chloroflexota bacterium]MDE2911057.1 UDP-N-acetylmuramate dehydrogenase [Chloroflexota bacterium]
MSPMPSWDAASIDGLQTGQSLARFTAARLGGPADYLHIAKDPDYSETLELARQAWQRGLAVTVIGGGANILVSDAGIRGLTIINRATAISHEIEAEAGIVTASSGTNLIRLARYCQENGLSGMEWAIAVPGTVGGAVVNNAGAHGSDIARSLARTLILDGDLGERRIETLGMQFGYRHSQLKVRGDRRFFVMKAAFRLERDKPEAIQERMDQYNDYRRRTQPPGASLGSIFKNPPGDFAGRLIESTGLKGLRVGSVQVSAVHANFFVNTGDGATASDYSELIRQVRERVAKATGVALELEIQTLGDWD